jgi:predicted permease
MSVKARLRSVVRALRRGDDLRDDMSGEFRHHIELRTADLVRAGLSAQEAATQARMEFGDPEHYLEEARRSRGLSWLDGLGISLLDLRLGARMLIKYPGLTLAGGFGMAVAVAIGAGVFDSTAAFFFARLPVPEGDRVVAVENWDVTANSPAAPTLSDLAAWRGDVGSIVQLSAYRPTSRNLIVPGGVAEAVQVAEMTASAFDVVRVAPLLGRRLLAEDEGPGAPPVVIIGYDAWQSRFAGDRAVIGRQVRLGDAVHTIVGVMPRGFGFPVNHQYWTPLRTNAATAPAVSVGVFGRLAPGITLESAQAELTTMGTRAVASARESRPALRPRVRPYTQGANGLASGSPVEVQLLRFVVSLLLVIVCLNVAMLVYARTATRHGEIAVRTALGASRRRIVSQLFGEALVLSAIASALGLAVARLGIRQIQAVMPPDVAERLPYWITFDMSAATVAYVAILTVVAAAIAGVMPALQATGQRLQERLRTMSGGSSYRLGKTWNALVVLQVVFAVALLPSATYSVWYWAEHASVKPGFATDQFVTASLELDGDEGMAPDAAFLRRYAARQREVAERLVSTGAASSVTYSAHLPGHEPSELVELDRPPHAAPEKLTRTRDGVTAYETGVGHVDPHFFATLDVPLLFGRTLGAGDATPQATGVVVNETFARQLLGDARPLGRRFRYAADSGSRRWLEVVGVVSDFPSAVAVDAARPRVYHALSEGASYPLAVYARPRGSDAQAFVAQLRGVTLSVDPMLRPSNPQRLDAALQSEQSALRMVAIGFAVVTLAVLLLSAAGIYALMSFTVTQRRREVGIRVALGAQPRSVLLSIFRRALAQLAAGVVIGGAIATLLDAAQGGEMLGGHATVLLPIVGATMTVVGLAAALGPARRGLRIQPTEALKADA